MKFPVFFQVTSRKAFSPQRAQRSPRNSALRDFPIYPPCPEATACAFGSSKQDCRCCEEETLGGSVVQSGRTADCVTEVLTQSLRLAHTSVLQSCSIPSRPPIPLRRVRIPYATGHSGRWQFVVRPPSAGWIHRAFSLLVQCR